jgi:LPXTG-site transpeptidase (sortase) family protein
VVRSAHRHRDEHGGHRFRWYAVLGLALLSVAAVAWTATAWPSAERALRDVRAPAGSGLSAPSPTGPALDTGEPARTSRRPAGRPEHVEVPSLGLHARVLPIDVAGGVLTPPDDPTTVGWWREGALAGAASGTVVLTGHTVHDGGGAMDDLEQVQPREQVLLTVRGTAVVYRVTRVEVLSKQALADRAEALFGQQVPARLVLVTCEDWNGREYESNVVVTARPVRR